MKRISLGRALIALILASSALTGTSCSAEAQIRFLNPGFSFGPTLRPLGSRFPTNIGGYDVPFFVVNPQGIRSGYLGPNGPYSAPVDPNAAHAYPNGAPMGAVGSSGLFAPFSGSGSTENTSQAEIATGNGAASANVRNAPVTASNSLYGTQPIPRTSDSIEARIDKDNRLIIKWSGEPKAVASITFALLDKDRKPLKQEKITKLPTQASLSITSKTSYYQVHIEYVNGTTTNVISPL